MCPIWRWNAAFANESREGAGMTWPGNDSFMGDVSCMQATNFVVQLAGTRAEPAVPSKFQRPSDPDDSVLRQTLPAAIPGAVECR